MDGKGLVVEQVRRPADELQVIDEVEASPLVCQVDGEHRTAGLTKLLACQSIEGVVQGWKSMFQPLMSETKQGLLIYSIT